MMLERSGKRPAWERAMQPAPVDPGVLGARLRQQQQIDDPAFGCAEPLELEARSALWPHARQWALIELTGWLNDGARRLEEYRFTAAPGASSLPPFAGPGLPVAIVFERTPNGASRARLYSVRALAARRAALLPIDPHLQPAAGRDGALGRHLAALQAADLSAALEAFGPEARVQDFDGEVYQGRSQLRAVHLAWSEHGGRKLRCCTRLDGSMRTALELQDEAGRPALAVYERDAAQHLAALRLYA
jgi:hypothetical protein